MYVDKKKHKYKYLAGIHCIIFTVNDEFIIKGTVQPNAVTAPCCKFR